MVSGDRSAVKDDQYFIDNRSLIFGKGRYKNNSRIKFKKSNFLLKQIYSRRSTRRAGSDFTAWGSPFSVQISTSSKFAALFVRKQTRIRQVLYQGKSCKSWSFRCLLTLLNLFSQVTLDIPYASPPQGMKYFTIIGPHIDCMDDQYLVST